MDLNELNKVIKDKKASKCYLARAMGLTNMGLENKLRGETQFKVDEVNCLKKLLLLSDEETINIFFK